MSGHAAGVVTGKTLERLRAQDAKALAKQERAAERAERWARAHGTREQFETFIDRSAGEDGCHLWTGPTDVNHRESNQPNCASYDVGVYVIEGLNSQFAHRVEVMIRYNLTDLPSDIDIAPTCGNHLCVNLRHLVVREHCGKDRIQNQVSVESFFCAEVAKQDHRNELEKRADKLLAQAAA